MSDHLQQLLQQRKELEQQIQDSMSDKETQRLEDELYNLNHSINIVEKYDR
jgi:hypothetical protein